MITSIERLSEVCCSQKEIIIYGAGLVAHTLVSYLYKKNIGIDIFCIIVSDKQNNVAHILGVPVCTLEDLPLEERKKTMIVATLENCHTAIEKYLKDNGITDNVEYINNVTYAQMRREISDYSVDVFDYTKRMKLETQKSMNEILYRLNKLEKCIQWQANSYDECLEEKDYPDAVCEWYFKRRGRRLDFNKLITYTEKLQWLKLYDNSYKKTSLTDKYIVRHWIKDKIGGKYLVPLLGTWNYFEEIDFSKLPDQFVLKCNHGCGYNLVVRDKKNLNMISAKRKFDRWMKQNFAMMGGLQLQYDGIKPVIMAEEYLENANQDLYDYKVWCFNGKAYYIMFLAERDKKLKMAFYDRDWNRVNISYDHPRYSGVVKKPERLNELLSLAETLAQGFYHVRVDFYVLNDGTIKFSEMTFTPASGGMSWNPPEVDDYLGKLLYIPELEK